RLGEKEQAISWLQKSFDMGWRNLAEIRIDNDLESIKDDPRVKKMVGVADAAPATREEGFRSDLAFLYREIKRKHFDPYRQGTREQMADFVRKLDEDIPKLNDEQIMVGFVKLMKMAGDGHTSIRPAIHKGAPVGFYLFEEGLYVTAAMPSYADLLGAKVVKIGD